MADRITRNVPADLEVRAAQRTIFGIVCPFDAPTEIHERGGRYVETFKRGSFARTIAERADRVKLLAAHGHDRLPVGRAALLREDVSGLYGEFRVSRTSQGDEILELVTDQALDAFSVGFQPVRERTTPDGTVERLEVKLVEVSVVAIGAYAGAQIAGMRSATPKTISVRAAEQWLSLVLESTRSR